MKFKLWRLPSSIQLSIAQKLIFSFCAIVGLLLLIAVLSYLRVATLNQEISLTNTSRYPNIVLVHLIKDQVNDGINTINNMLNISDAEDLKNQYPKLMHSAQVTDETIKKLNSLVMTEEAKKSLKMLVELQARYTKSHAEFVKFMQENNVDEAKTTMLFAIQPAYIGYIQEIDHLLTHQSKIMDDASQQSDKYAKQTSVLIFVIATLALVLTGVVGTLTVRSITRPLNDAVAIAQRVADGDLTSEIITTSNDETGKMLNALKAMNDGLVTIVEQVRQGTETIVAASNEIASGNLDLSVRTEEQASSLDKTAVSMSSFTKAIKANADKAQQANHMAITASQDAVQGGNVVTDVIHTMEAINSSSKKIVDIISVIDGIAFQTNILALNAAVEAARAGEQGRGFAVVASEVRNLAQRSASAAKEIKTLIDQSVQNVNLGTKLVNQAGATMQTVVKSIQNVTDIIGDINAASNEQIAGIEGASQSIAEMDEVTQQNAALVEQAAAAAASMKDQANSLSVIVSRFKISGAAVVEDAFVTYQPALSLSA
jgi:methyl-accepting chemotaxis protein